MAFVRSDTWRSTLGALALVACSEHEPSDDPLDEENSELMQAIDAKYPEYNSVLFLDIVNATSPSSSLGEASSCSATYLGGAYILTAAHCALRLDSAAYTFGDPLDPSEGVGAVRLAYKDRTDHLAFLAGAIAFLHPSYTARATAIASDAALANLTGFSAVAPNYDNLFDAAVVKLAQPIQNKRVRPVTLSVLSHADLERAQRIGFVGAGYGMRDADHHLRFGWLRFDSLEATEIRARQPASRLSYTTQGDSGGPLFFRDQQVGIDSTGSYVTRNGVRLKTTDYARITHEVKVWIERVAAGKVDPISTRPVLPIAKNHPPYL